MSLSTGQVHIDSAIGNYSLKTSNKSKSKGMKVKNVGKREKVTVGIKTRRPERTP